MIHYVLLGIELDLYAPSEYGTIYWCVVLHYFFYDFRPFVLNHVVTHVLKIGIWTICTARDCRTST